MVALMRAEENAGCLNRGFLQPKCGEKNRMGYSMIARPKLQIPAEKCAAQVLAVREGTRKTEREGPAR